MVPFQLFTFVLWLLAISLRVLFVMNTPNYVYSPVFNDERNGEFITGPKNQSYQDYLQVLNSNGSRSTTEIHSILRYMNASRFSYQSYYQQSYDNMWTRPFRAPKNFLDERNVYFFIMDPIHVSPMLKSATGSLKKSCFAKESYLNKNDILIDSRFHLTECCPSLVSRESSAVVTQPRNSTLPVGFLET